MATVWRESTREIEMMGLKYKMHTVDWWWVLPLSICTATPGVWWLLEWIQTLQKLWEYFPPLLHSWYRPILPAVERGLQKLQRVGETPRHRSKGTVELLPGVIFSCEKLTQLLICGLHLHLVSFSYCFSE